jgi:RNA polymerase sigma factor for flagellar operon FliA
VIDELRRLDFVPRHHRAQAVAPCVVWMEDLARGNEEVEFVDPSAVDPSVLLAGAADARALVAAVDALPARERTIIRMRYFESMTVHEIATQLSLSDPRVSQLHARAVSRLREALAA